MAKARRQSNEDIQAALDRINNRPHATLYKSGAFSLGVDTQLVSWDGIVTSNKITFSGSAITFEESGVYKATVSYRVENDTWTKWWIEDNASNVKGESIWAGTAGAVGARGPNVYEFLFEVVSPGVHKVYAFHDGGTSIFNPGPSGVFPGHTNRTMTVTIEKIRDL